MHRETSLCTLVGEDNDHDGEGEAEEEDDREEEDEDDGVFIHDSRCISLNIRSWDSVT